MSIIPILPFLLLVAISSVHVAGQCPTWFREAEDGTCECGSDLGGAVRCNKYTETVSIAAGFCMTYDTESNQTLAGVCRARYPQRLEYVNHTHSMGYFTLPQNTTKLNELCEAHHTTGQLCGECMDGYGWAINTPYTQCTKCRSQVATLYILLLMFLPLNIFFAVVIVFRPNFPSGKMIGYIMYCQLSLATMQGTVGYYNSLLDSLDMNWQLALKLSFDVSGIWWYGLSFFYSIGQNVCFTTKMTQLQVISLQYIYVLYPLLLVFITWLCIELHARDFRLVVYLWKPFHKCFAKVRRNWSASDSIIHAYATFFFLSYSSLAFIFHATFFTVNIYSIDNRVVNTVLLYDPNLTRFSTGHLPYAIPAILLLFFLGVCPTLFLCLYPTKLFKKCCSLQSRMHLLIKIYIDTFQRCYKDGLDGSYDFTFLSSAPMFAYLMLAVFTFAKHEFQSIKISTFGCFLAYLIISIVIAFVKPFKYLYLNMSFSFHFFITSLQTAIFVLWYESQIPSHYLAMACTLLLLLPHVLALATVVYHLLHHIRCVRTVFITVTEKISVILHGAPGMTESLPDRLQNSSAYRQLVTVQY